MAITIERLNTIKLIDEILGFVGAGSPTHSPAA